VKIYEHLNFFSVSVVQFLASRYIMRQNRTSEWNVMTIWISRELPFFNFERLDILCALIGHPSEKLWPFEFLENFYCSILSISIYYAPKSDFRVKCYDHLNFSRASVFQFWASRYIMLLNRTCEWKLWPFKFSRLSVDQSRASRYIMHLNRTSEWKVMTIWICRDLPLFNFECLDILCTSIVNLSEKF